MKTFISFADDDKQWVEQFAAALQREKVAPILAPSDIGAGRKWQTELRRNLRHSDAVISVWPMGGMPQPKVMFETGAALALKKPLMVVVSPTSKRSVGSGDLQRHQMLIRGTPQGTARQVALALREHRSLA